MLRRALVLPRLTSFAFLAIGLMLLLAWGAPPPFAVTFRFGNEVIGPEPALDLVLPNVEPRGVTLAGSPEKPGAGSAARVAEIWITLAESAATRRIADLARATATDKPVTGTCEISVAAQRGAKARHYTISGCFARSVEVSGTARRVTLGYSAINVSE